MSFIDKPVRVRYAPSPTGRLHLGGARTALYNYLLARQTGGQFIFRLEDTDRKRFVEGAAEEQMDGLRWLGLEWDEGPDIGGPHSPYKQSQRKEIYRDYAKQLISQGKAYYCFCSPKRLQRIRHEKQKRKEMALYDGNCRSLDLAEAQERVERGESHVIRMKMPKTGKTVMQDLMRGEITVENKNLDDCIIIKSDGLALYHLAAIVDDHLMGITHVFRGAEWLSTFPLHTQIIKALDWQAPVWAHLSVFLKPSGKGKMSKREAGQLPKDGRSIFIQDLREYGYVPEAVNNWIALMGWSYDDHTEFFNLTELVDKFSLSKLNPAPAGINFTKLDHFNGQHIRNLSVDDFVERIKPYFERAEYEVDDELLHKIAPIIQKRTPVLDEVTHMAGFFFDEHIEPDPENLIGKKMDRTASLEALGETYRVLNQLEAITPETAEKPMRDLANKLELKAGQLFGILRMAVTGQRVSPPLFETMEVIGVEKVLERVEIAIGLLESVM